MRALTAQELYFCASARPKLPPGDFLGSFSSQKETGHLGCFLLPCYKFKFQWFNGKPMSWQKVKVLTSEQNAPKAMLTWASGRLAGTVHVDELPQLLSLLRRVLGLGGTARSARQAELPITKRWCISNEWRKERDRERRRKKSKKERERNALSNPHSHRR